MYGKLNIDGTLSSANKQHEGFVSLELFDRKTEETKIFKNTDVGGIFWYATYYKEVDGKYIVDTVKEAKMETDELEKEVKINKDLALGSLVVDVNTVPFDANNQSINYMSSVLAVANFKYNQAVSAGADITATYTTIYKTIIKWKNANNTVSDVQLETVAEALEASMSAVGSIKTGV